MGHTPRSGSVPCPGEPVWDVATPLSISTALSHQEAAVSLWAVHRTSNSPSGRTVGPLSAIA